MVRLYICSEEMGLILQLVEEVNKYSNIEIAGISTMILHDSSEVMRKRSDVLILHYDLDYQKSLALLEELSIKGELQSLRIIMLYDEMNSKVFELMDTYHFEYFLVKPYQASQIIEMIERMPLSYDNNLDKESHIIYEILHKLAIPSHFKGYQYLKTGIALYTKENKAMHVLYDEIAKTHNTTAIRVERCMRSAIQSAYIHNPQAICIYQRKPCVSHIIKYASEQLHLALGDYYE